MTLSKDIYFAQIPEWVLFHADLSPQAVRLYGVLSRYADGRCWPGRELLATQLHVASTKTVDRAIKELQTALAVTVTARYDDAGDRTSNGYTVHVAPPEGVASRMSPPPVTEVPTGGAMDVALTRATSNQTPQPPASGGLRSTCRRHPTTPLAGCARCDTALRASARVDADTELRRLQHVEPECEHSIPAGRAPSPHNPSRPICTGCLQENVTPALASDNT